MNTIYGRNTILETLNSHPESISKVYVQISKHDTKITEILIKAKQKSIAVGKASSQKLTAICNTDKHQGVCAIISHIQVVPLRTLLENLQNTPKKILFAILDCIQDPHNMGAIIRTAECAGADAVLIPKDNSAPLNATVHKTSAGAISHIPVCKIGNVAQTIEELKKHNIWVVGSDSDEHSQIYTSFDFNQHVAVVIGSEGNGIRPLVKRGCDAIVHIPLFGKISSLNASVAAGILFFEILRQRTNHLTS
ncbi:hypothetical protein CHS0354_024026 [Potamilus streckersoni]|uniref:RNA 2-O ribose methyltransferase substrate binding domain-containing protein n=1 Tax=Potamilus streckersoni TaxID=2493646 RepID=A0AAE0VLN8_9BIVA|nr:hypothetical protein CHS0354_024026 [Potamilus streckersoni]